MRVLSFLEKSKKWVSFFSSFLIWCCLFEQPCKLLSNSCNFLKETAFCSEMNVIKNCTTTYEGQLLYPNSGLPLLPRLNIMAAVVFVMFLLLVVKAIKFMTLTKEEKKRKRTRIFFLVLIFLSNLINSFMLKWKLNFLAGDCLLRLLFFVIFQ